MKKLALTLLILICFNAYSSENIIRGTKDVPTELNLLLESLQTGNKEQFKTLVPLITSIDQHAKNITKEDVFLLGKAEIYKTLLKNFDDPVTAPINGESLKVLKLAIEKTKDPFSLWFLNALLTDTQTLVNNKAYQEFLMSNKTPEVLNKIENRRLRRRAELLQNWISKLSPENAEFHDQFRFLLAPKMNEALVNIKNTFALLSRESKIGQFEVEASSPDQWKFFTVQTLAPQKAAPKEKTVEEILSRDELPKPSNENWLEEDTPEALKNLPKPVDDADWLEDF